jgi:hypothetical protein
MAANTEEYHGYIIHWDTVETPNTGGWTARAAIVSPAEPVDLSAIPVTGKLDRFATEEEARDHVIRAAREWIDGVLNRPDNSG